VAAERYEEFNDLIYCLEGAISCKELGLGRPNCKGIIAMSDIEEYPHDGGIEVPGKEGKWWVYVHCQRCGYDASWWKVIRRLKKE
jgi:hypothetical protein